MSKNLNTPKPEEGSERDFSKEIADLLKPETSMDAIQRLIKDGYNVTRSFDPEQNLYFKEYIKDLKDAGKDYKFVLGDKLHNKITVLEK